MKIAQIMDVMERLAPARLAESWDHVGLQIGDPEAEADTVLVTLTPSRAVLDEAVDRNAHMVLSHHPLIFKPLESLTGKTPVEKLAVDYVKNDMALLAAHTNWDNAPGGINDVLAETLGLQDIEPLMLTGAKFKKFVVFVPEEQADSVAHAITRAGAGGIGNYSDCTFRTPGTGTFKPGAEANPHIGERGTLEYVREIRVETIVPEETLSAVIAAMREVHPYEEPAFDLYSLENQRLEPGLGRVGVLPKALPAKDFVAAVGQKLHVPGIRFAGDGSRMVRRIGLCGGGGANFYKEALKKGCDAYVSGDAKYHTFADARDEGIILVDAGHAETEQPGVDVLCEKLQAELPDVDFLLSHNKGSAYQVIP